MQRQPLVIANWKMNGDRALVVTMADALRDSAAQHAGVSVVVCPPAVLMPAWQQVAFYDNVQLGAQDANENSSGAHTGEHSLALVQEAGASMVLIGHSERRQFYGDNAKRIAAKVSHVLESSPMTAVLCVGESAQEREQQRTFDVIAQQLNEALQNIDSAERLVIAYEPVWAIGTGLTASPEQAQEVHAFIRNWLNEKFGPSGANLQILYGGSVKADNAEQLFAQADIDGGLIGGASLVPEQFVAICDAAQTRSK
ncbi:triose-phosphate isomerase [Pseudidiomarina gelatinasegens]|uniref:triose-phosphate isomerase n=1 Tax=Pseudidiomarina gelatinasegens TaxID=2487740 RepID=UPI003A9803D7